MTQQVKLEKQGTQNKTKNVYLSNIVEANEKKEWEEAPMRILVLISQKVEIMINTRKYL